MDLTLINPPETDSEGNTRTLSIACATFENQLIFATRMRDTAFKRSLKKVALGTVVKMDSAMGSFTLHKNSARYSDKKSLFRLIASPMPLPSVFVVKNASKICSGFSFQTVSIAGLVSAPTLGTSIKAVDGRQPRCRF